MQTAMRPVFQEKADLLAALLKRSKSVRAEAMAKIGQGAPRFQASGKGRIWNVVEIATGSVQGFAFSYRTALFFVAAMEAATASKEAAI